MTTTANTARPDLGAQEGQDEFLPARTRRLVAGAARINEVRGLGLSGSRIRKLVHRFVREGRSDIDLYSAFIAYADETGERAVRNVLRDQGLRR